MPDPREDRRTMLDSVVEIVKRERGATGPVQELVAECRDVLERCLFDKDAALAVLRGEHELDDEPWSRCPECDCDTYFQFRTDLGGHTFAVGPTTVFVCEGCQHTVLRARATMHDGLWWEQGLRLRARPDDIGHPYRGDAIELVEEEAEEDDGDADAPPAEDSQPVDWGDRRVCPDGACIGIIRDDGRCSVCGRAEPPAG